MKKILILISILTFLIGCNSNDLEESQDYLYIGPVFDIALEMSVKDSNGNDLLDPTNPNSLDTDDIKLFYLINGKVQEINNGENSSMSKNFKIYYNDQVSNYVINIFKNYSDTENLPITYIQWEENDTDTINTLYKETDKINFFVQEKIWYNDELIWDKEMTNSKPFFELVK